MQNRYFAPIEGETQSPRSPLEMAREYFDIEGWNVYQHYEFLVSSGAVKLTDMEETAKIAPTQRYFLIIYNSDEEKAKRESRLRPGLVNKTVGGYL